MSKSTRVFVGIVCVTSLLVAGAAFAATAAVYRAGMVRVDVEGTATSGGVSIRVPGILLPVALDLVPDSALRDGAREVKQYLPAARAAFDELSRCPDGVFVEVDSDGDHVRIGKKDGVFFVDVRSDGEIVHIALPLHAVGPVLARLESVARQTV